MTAVARLPRLATSTAEATAEPRERLISLPADELIEDDTPDPPTTSRQAPASGIRRAPPPLPSTRLASAPPPPPVRARVRDEALAGAILERVHTMSFLDDALQAARHCLVVLGDLLPCRASVVHFFDASSREFIVAVARGEQHKSTLLKRHKMSDPFLRVAKAHGGPFSWNDLSGGSLRSIGRYVALGSVARVLACPVIVGARARWLAAIELVDPLDGDPFDAAAEISVAHVARHLADFLTIHGVIVEVAAIGRFAHTDA